MANYEIKEIRKNRYVKLVDGKVIGSASLGERYTYWLLKHGPEVEPGFIGTSLAITVVLGFLAALKIWVGLRIIFLIAFIFQIFATGVIYWNYIRPRLPDTFTNYLTAKANGYSGDLLPYLVYLYPKYLIFLLFDILLKVIPVQWGREHISKPFRRFLDSYQAVEFAYLTIFGVVALIVLMIDLYVVYDILVAYIPSLAVLG